MLYIIIVGIVFIVPFHVFLILHGEFYNQKSSMVTFTIRNPVFCIKKKTYIFLFSSPLSSVTLATCDMESHLYEVHFSDRKLCSTRPVSIFMSEIILFLLRAAPPPSSQPSIRERLAVRFTNREFSGAQG